MHVDHAYMLIFLMRVGVGLRLCAGFAKLELLVCVCAMQLCLPVCMLSRVTVVCVDFPNA